MSYIKFDKKRLVNLEYSLQKELLRTNRAGSYASTSIVRCNTRKYHGLLVCPQPQIDGLHHVLLSTLDVTVVQRNAEFNLGIHKYQDNLYEPGGHKYIRDFESEPIPKLTYRVGGVILTAETVFAMEEDRILIRYTLQEANSPTRLKFNPLLAFRNTHFLSKANEGVNTSFAKVKNGISMRMYDNYDLLYMQFSKVSHFNPRPDWYYGIEYTKEKTRGYEYKEDLYTPGIFELPIEKGESIIFSAGLKDVGSKRLRSLFEKEIKNRIPRNNFINCLENAAEQFFVNRNGDTKLIAGYPWFSIHGRDSFIALPGLTLPQDDEDTFIKVLDSLIAIMQGPFFPASIHGKETKYNSVDTSLWFFWSLQKFISFTGKHKLIWDKYNKVMENILQAYKKGTEYNIHMLDNGLLYAGNENDALTWMNTIIDDKPVIDRNGLAVEVNALWYNAICFYVNLFEKTNSKKANKSWYEIIQKIEYHFTETFWDERLGYLADTVRGNQKEFAVRPNQLFAASLPFSPITDDIKYLVLARIKQELLTPRGIRTLSPKNPNYLGVYIGDIRSRDKAYHQGSAFPWLLGHFFEAYLKLHGEAGIGLTKRILAGFEEEMTETGIGTISELFYGDPPQKGKGAISHAWSVAELLRLNYLINDFENNTNHKK
ncbi:MAG: amylo-alpha-1,6-glucosidase [Bacteroidales bacterium]|nr:amylo-alpha-1,6-glucosidase [Bacteroidales bacterium]MCF8404338.1 amylo-alpha-1,6-glucosidase [Bacteroidales bacterium]